MATRHNNTLRRRGRARLDHAPGRLRYAATQQHIEVRVDPKFNVWFEIDGEVAASRWRMELLAAIGRLGSITAGAEALGVPYRVAWQKIHEMEERLGEELLDTRTGGSHGGGARLTDAGRIHVERMKTFCERSDAAIEEIYEGVFGESPGT